MKRVLITIIALSALCACDTTNVDNRRITDGVIIIDITHKGHDYVVFKAGYGATTLHSPNCPCQKEDLL